MTISMLGYGVTYQNGVDLKVHGIEAIKELQGLGFGKVTPNNGKNSDMCKTELSFPENLKSLWGTICTWISSSHRMCRSRI